MKLLHLKYKMHKLVNLVFYLIIFGLGFLLGFGVEKINFNNLISQFLFIDNVYAEETIDEQGITYVCRDSRNLFNSQFEVGYLLDSSGKIRLYEGRLYNSNLIKLKENTTYTLSSNVPIGNIWLYSSLDFETGVKSFANSYGTFSYTFKTDTNALYFGVWFESSNVNWVMLQQGSIATPYEPYGEEICYEKKDNSFYNFSQDIFGEVDEENKFIYDFITFGLVVTCFTLFVLIVGYIFKKFFGG